MVSGGGGGGSEISSRPWRGFVSQKVEAACHFLVPSDMALAACSLAQIGRLVEQIGLPIFCSFLVGDWFIYIRRLYDCLMQKR